MFDGFDEIPADERSALSQWISEQIQCFDRSTFILASRPTAYTEDFADPLRTKVWVRPLTPQQQTVFVQQWYSCQEKLDRGGRNTPEVQREAERNAENLLYQIHHPNRPELADLAKNPLLLTLLATYHRSDPGVELPRQRAELYQDICTLQLRKRPDVRNVAMPLSAGDRQAVLQAVALTMMQRQVKLVAEAELVGLIAQILKDQQQATVSAQDFLNQIIAVSELIVRQGLEGCEFSHLSFQEFLAAAQIKALKQEDLLYPYLQDDDRDSGSEERDWWRQTILLYAAQTNPTTLIKTALRQGASNLAYACYQETQRTLDPTIEAALKALQPAVQTSRYAELERLLQAQQWREADIETYRLIITTVGKETGQYLESEESRNFDCAALLAIDGLWVKYSQGRFGISVQEAIYMRCGGKPDGSTPSREVWTKFAEAVGWRMNQEWQRDYEELASRVSLSSPKGMFPMGIFLRRAGEGKKNYVMKFSSLTSRLVNCSTR